MMLCVVHHATFCLRDIGENHCCMWMEVRGRRVTESAASFNHVLTRSNEGQVPMTIATGKPLITRIPAAGDRELVVVMRGVKQRDWDHLYTGLRLTSHMHQIHIKF